MLPRDRRPTDRSIAARLTRAVDEFAALPICPIGRALVRTAHAVPLISHLQRCQICKPVWPQFCEIMHRLLSPVLQPPPGDAR